MSVDSAISLFQTALLVGLLYAAFTIGLSLSFRVLNYPDLGIEGSAILGGALCAKVLAATGNPWLALVAGTIGGGVAGLFTAFQHLYLGVSKLLSGIITTAVLYSINIRVLEGHANVRLQNVRTIFDIFNSGQNRWVEIFIIAFIVFVIAGCCALLFATKGGYLLRTLGSNEKFLVALGYNPKTITFLGLALSNAVIGLGGAILIQYQHSCDVNMSVGLLVSALAALVLGEAIYTARRMGRYLSAAITGTIIYNAAIALVLFSWSSNWDKLVMSSDVRLLSGLLLLVPIVLSRKRGDRFKLFKSDW